MFTFAATLALSAAAGSLGASAMPVPAIAAPGDSVVQVSGGCGPNGHRGPYGQCRPNYRGCPPGFHLGRYGRCRPNF